RERVVHNDDGSIETSKIKFNSKYILGNLLVCGDCGASYRRRAERGKVLWRCDTRIEKRENECRHSLPINEERLKKILDKNLSDMDYDVTIIKSVIDKNEIYSHKKL
ncbi:MAG: zinc ribbon domain-containing protein, partial [Aminipila sp.]